jgi:hypothetical protein
MKTRIFGDNHESKIWGTSTHLVPKDKILKPEVLNSLPDASRLSGSLQDLFACGPRKILFQKHSV